MMKRVKRFISILMAIFLFLESGRIETFGLNRVLEVEAAGKIKISTKEVTLQEGRIKRIYIRTDIDVDDLATDTNLRVASVAFDNAHIKGNRIPVWIVAYKPGSTKVTISKWHDETKVEFTVKVVSEKKKLKDPGMTYEEAEAENNKPATNPEYTSTSNKKKTKVKENIARTIAETIAERYKDPESLQIITIERGTYKFEEDYEGRNYYLDTSSLYKKYKYKITARAKNSFGAYVFGYFYITSDFKTWSVEDYYEETLFLDEWTDDIFSREAVKEVQKLTMQFYHEL